MENYSYHETEPENRRDNYEAQSVVDFNLSALGRSLVPNSIKIVGEFVVLADGTTQVAAGVRSTHKINPKAGIGSVVESISCSTINQGNLELYNNYSRGVVMEETGTSYLDDYNQASKQVELKAPSEVISGLYCNTDPQNYANNAGGFSAANRNITFAFKPRCCLNRFSGGNLAFSKTGAMKLSLTLARNLSALYGVNLNANVKYQLRKLKLCYATVPSEAKPSPVLMNKVHNIKTSISSQLANISANVPSSSVKGVSISFQKQSEENVSGIDNYKLQRLDGLNNLTFIFNDSLNKYINYSLDTDSAILDHAIASFGSMGHNNVNVSQIAKSNNYIVGTAFDTFVDLTRSSFDVQLQSSLNTAHNVYLYFHSTIQL